MTRGGVKSEAYDSMEFAAFVALGFASRVFGLAGAKLAEVFCCAGGYVCEEFHFYAA